MIWRRTLLIFPVFIGMGVQMHIYLGNRISTVGIGGMLGEVTAIYVMTNLLVMLIRKSGKLTADGAAVRATWAAAVAFLILSAIGASSS